MKLTGILPPLPTPFDRDGNLDSSGLASVITELVPLVDGFLVLGSNGEASYLSEPEREEVLRAARAAIPRNKPMIVGTGGEATRLVIERNKSAAQAGAEAVMVLPPCYYRAQMTESVLLDHYHAVAEVSSVPLILYNIPQATALSLTPALVGRLAAHPNIIGLKDSSGDVNALTEIMRMVPADFAVFTGNAPTLLPALALGAVGGILAVANVAPGAYRKLLEEYGNGRLAHAREIQLRFNPLALAVTTVYGVPGLKAAMRTLGLRAGYPRRPLRDVSEEEVQRITKLLDRLEVPVAVASG